MLRVWKLSSVIVLCVTFSAWVSATPITCLPMNERVATLDSASICKTGNDENINTPAEVSALFGGVWVKEGELTGNGTNDLLTVNLTSGAWGNNNVAGNWNIDSSFWSMYGMAVITMHVGNGNGNPDFFAWLLTPNQLSGTFNYKDLDGRGGGLSNLFLFGSGQPNTRLPEPSVSLLLVIGLFSIFFARRRVSC